MGTGHGAISPRGEVRRLYAFVCYAPNSAEGERNPSKTAKANEIPRRGNASTRRAKTNTIRGLRGKEYDATGLVSTLRKSGIFEMPNCRVVGRLPLFLPLLKIDPIPFLVIAHVMPEEGWPAVCAENIEQL